MTSDPISTSFIVLLVLLIAWQTFSRHYVRRLQILLVRPHVELDRLKRPLSRWARLLMATSSGRGRVGSVPTKRWRGHIEQLGPNKWRVRIDLGRDGRGKRHRRSFTVNGTRADAEAKLRELLKDVDDDLLAVSGGPKTVNDLAEIWLEEIVATRKRPVTLRTYRDLYRIYVQAELGHLPVKSVTTAQISAFMTGLYHRPLKERVPKSRSAHARRRRRGADWQPRSPGSTNGKESVPSVFTPPALAGAGRGLGRTAARSVEEAAKQAALENREGYLSHSSMNKVLAVVKGMFRYAADQGYVKLSPAVAVEGYKRRRPRIDVLTKAERMRLIAEAKGTRWFALVFLLTTGGYRPSEILALTYGDIDFDNLTVTIDKKLTYFSKSDFLIERLTKNEAGVRDIPILESVAVSLKEHKAWQKQVGAIDPRFNLVFGDDRGLPIDSRSFMNDVLKPMAFRAGIKKNMTNYIFRHSVGTDLGKAKDWTALKDILGHSSVRTGMDNYDHPDEDRKREAIEKLNVDLG